MWSFCTSELSDHYTCICVDLPGHGESKEQASSLKEMASGLHQFMLLQGISQYDVIGHSMGGYLACEMSLLQPDSIQQIVLMNSHADCDPEDKKTQRERMSELLKSHFHIVVRESIPGLFLESNLDKCRPDIESLIDQAAQFDSLEVARCSDAMKNRPNYIPQLAAIKQKIIFITGDHDPIMRLEKITSQHDALINSNVVVIPNSGHMSYLEQAKATLDALLAQFNLHQS